MKEATSFDVTQSFSDFGLHPAILAAVLGAGYSQPTPIQAQALPPVMDGRDVMGAAQTGTGKTAAFSLPILHRLMPLANSSASPARHPVRALILTPTRELADQVAASVRLYTQGTPLRSAVVFGGVDIAPQKDTLRRGCEVLVATPGRLLDHIDQKTVNLSQVGILVLDEADRMLDMGFMPDLMRIVQMLPKLLVYAGSAQLTSLPLIESRSPLWLVFVAACVVNIRFVIFSAAMYPFFRHLSWKKRLGLGYLTGDISFVLFMARFGESAQRGIPQHVWYLMGAVVPGWISWQVASIAGIFFGTFIPDSWSLEFAAVLALLAVLLPLVATRPLFACLVVAGVVAWAGQQLPLRLGLLAAVICGVIAGVVVEQLQRKRTTQ